MCDLLHHQSAPEYESETFRGDPFQYHYFIYMFREVVELKIDYPHGRLERPVKYTEGETRHHKALHSTDSISGVSKGKAAVGKTL